MLDVHHCQASSRRVLFILLTPRGHLALFQNHLRHQPMPSDSSISKYPMSTTGFLSSLLPRACCGYIAAFLSNHCIYLPLESYADTVVVSACLSLLKRTPKMLAVLGLVCPAVSSPRHTLIWTWGSEDGPHSMGLTALYIFETTLRLLLSLNPDSPCFFANGKYWQPASVEQKSFYRITVLQMHQ